MSIEGISEPLKDRLKLLKSILVELKNIIKSS